MTNLDNAIIGAKVKMRKAAQNVTEKFTLKRKGEGNAVIITVVLLVIAIGLAITFRNAIGGWLDDFVGYFEHELDKFTSTT